MSRGIDYSKWDKMDFSDDEEDDQSSSSYEHNTPRVTRLDEPSSITFGNDDGGSINITQSNLKPHSGNSVQKALGKSIDATCDSGKSKKFHEKDTKLKLLTRNGGAYIDPSTQSETFWSQDRNETIFSVAFDSTKIASRDIRVEVKGALSYKDRFAAVGGNRAIDADIANSKGELIVSASSFSIPSSSILFRGHLAYSIHLPEDEEEVDWEIDTTSNLKNKKLVKITLSKALPMQGLTIWWNKPFLGFPEIDVVNDIEDRDKKRNTNGCDQRTPIKNHEQMKTVWDEAHRMFREKVKNREKQSIDIS